MHNPSILHIDTMDGDWCYKDLVLLHACFQLLTDFVEKENINETCDWQWDENHRNAKNEIDELYNWWKIRADLESRVIMDSIEDEQQYVKDNERLVRLINIRKYLWT